MTNSATAVSVDEVIAAGRFTSLTSSVIAEYAANATPKQREHLHGLFTAEHASRKAARQSRLLKAARLPAMKSLDGYDFTPVRLPDGFGRDQLTVEDMAREWQCDRTTVQALELNGPKSLFQVECGADSYRLVRCEWGECTAESAVAQ